MVAGFVGGAVGVMGTIMALEVKMRQGTEEGKGSGRDGRDEKEDVVTHIGDSDGHSFIISSLPVNERSTCS